MVVATTSGYQGLTFVHTWGYRREGDYAEQAELAVPGWLEHDGSALGQRLRADLATQRTQSGCAVA